MTALKETSTNIFSKNVALKMVYVFNCESLGMLLHGAEGNGNSNSNPTEARATTLNHRSPQPKHVGMPSKLCPSR